MVHAVQCQSVLFRLFSVTNYNAGFQENANTLPGRQVEVTAFLLSF
jgi:hypothetical protein